MKVFVVLGCHDYEGSTLVGVCSSKAKAKRLVEKTETHGDYDEVVIEKVYVDEATDQS